MVLDPRISYEKCAKRVFQRNRPDLDVQWAGERLTARFLSVVRSKF